MEIDKSYRIDHRRADVYAAWVSAETVIPPATAMDVLPQVGGHYRLLMKTAEFEMSNEGVFLQVVPEDYLHYTWQWSGDDEVSEVEVWFRDEGVSTRIDLRHSKLTNSESVQNHDVGWDSYVVGLEQFLSVN